MVVEAGGVEPTVRKKSHKTFYERRLCFRFRSVGAHNQASPELSRWMSPRASENWLKGNPVFYDTPNPAPQAGAGGMLAAIKQLERNYRYWQLN